MKKLAGLVLILAVLILGGYYGMGVITESTIKNNIGIINQSNGLFAQIMEYKRNWFTSTANIKWRLHVPERVVMGADGKSQIIPAQDYNMVIPVNIHHGPIIYADRRVRFGLGYAETRIVLPPEYNQQFDEAFSKESSRPQLDLNIFINYLNRSRVELSIPSFKLVSKDGTTHFDWKGLESRNQLSSNFSKAKGDITVDGLTFVKENMKAILGKVTTDYNLHRTDAGLYLGEANASLSALDVFNSNKKIFEITDANLSSKSNINQELFSTHLTFSVKSVINNNITYGPGSLEISLRNLDATVLAEINKQATTMQNGTDAERQKAMMALLPELPKLFNKGAEFEISKLNLKLPEGDVEANLLVSLPKGDSVNPFEIMQKTQGNAKLRMPQTLVKQLVRQSVKQQMSKQPGLQQVLIQQMQTQGGGQATPNQPVPTQDELAEMQANNQIHNMEQNGVIIVAGSDYVMDLKLDQGKFTVNGKPFDPAMMK